MKITLRSYALIAAAIAVPALANAEDAKPLTVEQCINILTGLNSLNCAGQQLNEPSSVCKPDSKQYKIGNARITVAMDIGAMTPVRDGFSKESQAFINDLPPLPSVKPGEADSPERSDAANAQNKRTNIYLRKLLDAPCPVNPGHIRTSDLNIGDGADQNQFPPSVLGVLWQIIDK